MFLSRNKKNNIYPCKPQFYFIKVGFEGVIDDMRDIEKNIHITFTIPWRNKKNNKNPTTNWKSEAKIQVKLSRNAFARHRQKYKWSYPEMPSQGIGRNTSEAIQKCLRKASAEIQVKLSRNAFARHRQKYKWSYPEMPSQGIGRRRHNKCHIWNHRRTKKEELVDSKRNGQWEQITHP